MSKIGKKPIAIPSGVDVQISGDSIIAKGPKGTLTKPLPQQVTVNVADGLVKIVPDNPRSKEGKIFWGLARSLVQNMISGAAN